MKYIRILPAICALALLSACATTQQHQLEVAARNSEAIKESLAGSPKLRQKALEACERVKRSERVTNAMALIANVSKEDVPRVVCQRVLRATVSGRISAKDLLEWRRTGMPSIEFIKVLQGR